MELQDQAEAVAEIVAVIVRGILTWTSSGSTRWIRREEFFVTRAKRNLDARRLYSAPVKRDTGLICDQTIVLNGFYASKDYPGHLRRIRYRDPETGKTLVFLTNQFALPALTICALYRCRWQVELFFKWIKQHLRIKLLRHLGERRPDANLDCHQRLCAGGDHQKATSPGCDPAYTATDFVADALREIAAATSLQARRSGRKQPYLRQAVEIVRVLTGHY